ncbi:MAG TPA: DUF4062 domain-containing protein [Pseudorhizobium sp.]|jgi:hypothetical protein|nr:DUF4062 domain-containing protein [Pseudorhizobium sp.]
MRIFISSLITGMEPHRIAAAAAVRSLNHEPVMAEDFGALPVSPQIACLQGLRESQAVVLILGAGYGVTQASGISATHEEYREAKDRYPVFAFVQSGVQREAAQAAFVDEVQKWDSGLFRDGFTTAEQLQEQITRRLHAWELSNQAGPVDGTALLKQAVSRIREEPRGYVRSGRELILSIASGPRQPILRPSQIEKDDLREAVLQAALFGPQRIFTADQPNRARVEDGELVIEHGQDTGIASLSGEGDILLKLPIKKASDGHGSMIVIQEHVADALGSGLRYASWLLDYIDPTHRLTHVALAATITGGDSLTWRTLKEQEASPNSYSMGMGSRERKPVHLSPGHRPRPALSHQQGELIEDLITLLRREFHQAH